MTFHATLNGTVSNVGNSAVTMVGFKWGTSSDNYSSEWTNPVPSTFPDFHYTVQGLDETKRYYYIAEAQNAAGWGYGTEIVFSLITVPKGFQTTTSMVALVPLHLLKRLLPKWLP